MPLFLLTDAARAAGVLLAALTFLSACGDTGTLAVDLRSARSEDALLAPPRPADVDTLRVMTWNLRFASTREGYEDWPTRRPDLAALLALSQVDVLGVQELVPERDGHRQLEDVQAMLPGFAYIGRSRSADPNDEHSGVYYRSARLEALREGYFWLSPAPTTPGSFGYGNQGNPRMATWVEFRDRRSTARFTLVNTHFDHRSREARYRAADQIAGYRSGDPAYANDGVELDPQLPMVLIGDFNVARSVREDWAPPGYSGPTVDPLKTTRMPALYAQLPTALTQYDPGLVPMAGNLSPYTRLVLDGPFVDALEVAERAYPLPIGTFNGFAELREGIIDWVLVSPELRVLQSYIETYRPQGQYPSDHLPVVADIALPG